MSSKNIKPYLTPNEVAKRLMISVESVRQLAEKRELLVSTTLGGIGDIEQMTSKPLREDADYHRKNLRRM